MHIRQEKPEDYEEIYELVKIAFETAAVKDGDEQDYVVALRESSRYIPELALVAEEDGRLIGHIMLTETELVSAGTRFRELLLSPLCVALPYRKQGVGAALIKESFRLAGERGYSAVFLCGDPKYYMEYGFREAADFGIVNGGDLPQKYVMAYELFPEALKNKNGTIRIV
jgi:predicted N-acetyltransferase YhbS